MLSEALGNHLAVAELRQGGIVVLPEKLDLLYHVASWYFIDKHRVASWYFMSGYSYLCRWSHQYPFCRFQVNLFGKQQNEIFTYTYQSN